MTSTPLSSAFEETQAKFEAAANGAQPFGGTTYAITPAHDEKVLCHFTIEQPDGAPPIEFTVKRLEYLPPRHAQDYDAWLRKRTADEAAWNAWLTKVANGTTTDDDKAPAEVDPVTPRELILKQLQMLIPKATYRRVERLTMGELEQIFDAWVGASTVAATSTR